MTGFSDGFKKKGIKQFSSFIPKNYLSLVVWGINLTSTVGNKFFRIELALVQKKNKFIYFFCPPYQFSVIIGLLLSDGWLTFGSKINKNARLGIGQSGANGGYFLFVFLSLSHYCSSYPIVRYRNRLGKPTVSLQFKTRSMLCITELRNLFYLDNKKTIPINIYDLLTPVALAQLIMGDGSWQRHGLILCTDSFSVEDVVRLVNVLIIKYRLECTIRYHRPTHPRIYISERSMPLLRTIVGPHIHYSMTYKLKSGKKLTI